MNPDKYFFKIIFLELLKNDILLNIHNVCFTVEKKRLIFLVENKITFTSYDSK